MYPACSREEALTGGPAAPGWLNQVSALSLKVPVSGVASISRPRVLDSAYRRSVADSSLQSGASLGRPKFRSARAFSPITGSGGTAVGSPTDEERTSSSVEKTKFSTGLTWSTQPSAVGVRVMLARSQLEGCPTVHV
jgi:hypothetical protein